MIYNENGMILNESMFRSKLKEDFEKKPELFLKDFERVSIYEYAKREYKTKDKIIEALTLGISTFCRPRIKWTATLLSNIEVDFDGCAFYDGKNIVALIFIVKEDNGTLIDYIEIAKKYRGHGLSKQLLDYATKEFGGEYLCVDNDNDVAKDVYFKYGFEVADEYNNCQYLRLKSKTQNISLKNCNESIINDIQAEKIFTKHNLWAPISKTSEYYLYSNSGKDQLLLEIDGKSFKIYLINKMANHKIINEAINKALDKGCNKTTIFKGVGVMLELYKKAGFNIISKDTNRFKYTLEKE